MSDITEFSTLVALIALSAGFYAFLFNRLENRIEHRIDSLAHDVSELRKGLGAQQQSLRKDLTEEFRAQRAEVLAQVSAIANAINASRP
jgi:F0F1-type ATP synthase membrane subunit b/b'